MRIAPQHHQLTRGALTNQRSTEACAVLCQHLQVVGGSSLQAVQLMGGHVSNERLHGLIRAWEEAYKCDHYM